MELEAARLSLCEEAILRDLLRRCQIFLPPGYARADAVRKLRSRAPSPGAGVGTVGRGRGGGTQAGDGNASAGRQGG